MNERLDDLIGKMAADRARNELVEARAAEEAQASEETWKRVEQTWHAKVQELAMLITEVNEKLQEREAGASFSIRADQRTSGATWVSSLYVALSAPGSRGRALSARVSLTAREQVAYTIAEHGLSVDRKVSGLHELDVDVWRDWLGDLLAAYLDHQAGR